MKKIIPLIGALVLMLSCSKPEQPSADEIKLIETSETIETGCGEGEIKISFSTNNTWTATSDVNWITVSPKKGSSGTMSITASISENMGTENRSGEISIKAGEASTKITITQAHKESDPVENTLVGLWHISTKVEGLPNYIVFNDKSNGVAYDGLNWWFGLTVLNTTSFIYSVKDSEAVTIKLSTGVNINTHFDTNYQGDPLLNFESGNIYYSKLTDNTDLPKHDEKDEPFVKVSKVTEVTYNTITVQCEVINTRILSQSITDYFTAHATNGDITWGPDYGHWARPKNITDNTYEITIKHLDPETQYTIYAEVVSGNDKSISENSLIVKTEAAPTEGDY